MCACACNIQLVCVYICVSPTSCVHVHAMYSLYVCIIVCVCVYVLCVCTYVWEGMVVTTGLPSVALLGALFSWHALTGGMCRKMQSEYLYCIYNTVICSYVHVFLSHSLYSTVEHCGTCI